ncbi:spermatogenesis-associated protein 6 isoform X2 [Clupea harengus]|uniref:Spermatogenesis-associated protein 6 isoform X2 n=1 Tax=Clupea harengus TaxID=7950 RepID=A0A6P8G4L3_CLUHA|nr:spermatogenesis-associated protein 6 isoform X2 [Clupea harengus]
MYSRTPDSSYHLPRGDVALSARHLPQCPHHGPVSEDALCTCRLSSIVPQKHGIYKGDATFFELIQLVPPEGEILATLEENTRDFLYPGPSVFPKARCPQRELLMKKSITFPGISPKVEFTTTTTIEECEVRDRRPAVSSNSSKSPVQSASVSRSPDTAVRKGPGSAATAAAASSGYDRPTVASLTRAPSPYTHRRMCQLSEDARQRLGHLQLGPHAFRKETRRQPPFVVPRSLSTSVLETSYWSSSSLSSTSWRSVLNESTHSAADASHLSSRRSTAAKGRMCSLKASPSPVETTRQRPSSSPVRRRPPAAHSTPILTSSSSKATQSPVLNRSSLKERFKNDESSPCRWEVIHKRVEKILRSGTARCQLTFDEDEDEHVDEGCHEPALSCDRQRLRDSPVSAHETSVHLDNGHYWSSRAAAYTGKPHRAVFEESLGRIYKNLYRNMSSTS